MAPLGRGQRMFKDGGEVTFGHVHLSITICRVLEVYTGDDKVLEMANRTLPDTECHRGGHNYGHNHSGRGVKGSGVKREATQWNGEEGEDPEKNWFWVENTPAEARALTHLEKELSNTLMFEHGGG